jgi:hypothetical protein
MRMVSVEEVVAKFGEYAQMLTFTETKDYIVIKPRQFLGSDNFAKIAAITRNNGGEYISAGKESHFRIPRANEPQVTTDLAERLGKVIAMLQQIKQEMEVKKE